jgi:fimbrial chaperone protein
MIRLCSLYLPLRIVPLLALWIPLLAQAAISPDRTRVIFQEPTASIGVGLKNTNSELPYIAQSWIEDESGKKVSGPLMVLPPLQRVEPNGNALLRIVKLPDASLPEDRESVFYLNIREIPPKTGSDNALQLALQSKLKLFYRPSSVKNESGGSLATGLQLKVDPAGKQLLVDNPTPFYITLVGLLAGPEKTSISTDSVMIAPFGNARLALNQTNFTQLWVSNMGDYGNQLDTPFVCVANICKAGTK